MMNMFNQLSHSTSDYTINFVHMYYLSTTPKEKSYLKVNKNTPPLKSRKSTRSRLGRYFNVDKGTKTNQTISTDSLAG